MKYLLDTHTLIWAVTAPQRLSPAARQLIESAEQRILVSAATFWEISLKHSLGKLLLEGILPEDFPKICAQMDIETLPLTPGVCASYHKLGVLHHRDPFDRMLIWLAKSEKFTLISKDEIMKLYEPEGLAVVW